MTEDKDCHPWDKPYYYAWQVAVYWCGADRNIHLDEHGLPVADPINHCVRPRAEWIMDAMERRELRYGRDGKAVGEGDQVARPKRTVARSDLRAWFVAHRSERPPFLFGEDERRAHAAIDADSFRVLQADLQAARSRLEKANERIRHFETLASEQQAELASLRSMIDKTQTLNPRAETTHLNIIAGLLDLLIRASDLKSENDITNALLQHHAGKPGISLRNLQKHFPQAKRSLASSKS